MPRIAGVMTPNPTPYCMCGCGNLASVATRSRTSTGEVKGFPQCFIKGHGPTVGLRQPGEKLCVNCKTMKPLDDYHAAKRLFDGHQATCKDCQYVQTDTRQRGNRERHRENIRRGHKNRKATPERDPLKRKARKQLAYAVESGRTIRPKRCERCKKKCTPHGHHHDYAKPLDVEWLCPLCHSDKHPRQRKLAIK